MKDINIFEKKRVGTCSKDCYGSCVFEGIWNDKALEQKFLYALPMKKHPFTNGFFCPKFKSREDLVYHQLRVKHPLLRTGPKSENNFKKISLNSALDIISKKIIQICNDNNCNSILGTFYSGNSGLISQYAPLRFFRKIGATITNGGICNEGGCAGLKQLFGTYSTTNPFQLVNPATKLLVIWGSNLSVSNNHAYYLVKKALKKGVKLIVVDSRMTKIAEKAHCFLHIFPGTENLLVKIILHEIITHNAEDKEFLTQNVDQYSSIFREVAEISKENLLSQIGISYSLIKEFIKLLFEYKHHTLFNIGFGVQKDYYGGRIVKSIALIQIILGNLGKPGTGLIYSQSDFLKPLINSIQNYISGFKSKLKIPEISLINLGSNLLSREYQLLFIYNFNPASSLPNQNLLKEALLKKNLYIIVIEQFLNETTKYADIVIPAKFDLESSDLISSYYVPSISINIGGPCPYNECVSNYEFFQLLAKKLGFDKSDFYQESEETIFKNCIKMLPLNIQKELKSKGFYLFLDNNDVPFEDLKFPTPNNKIQTIGPHFNYEKPELIRRTNLKNDEFKLITPSHPHFLHSQLGLLNSKYIDDFSKVYLSPRDIERIGLKIDSEVIVSNEFGKGLYKLAESSILKSRTALIYHGLSSDLKGSANANFFIPDKPEELGLSGVYNSAIVRIIKRSNNI
ncbi:MAG: molybdopterin-dependent oxidoreductase [Promethearchaeota archaeon]